ncbi:C-type mannose receptor 2-like isoform X3 [Mizuhopecten yessoensis]|uniref:C-type mannose receptor 2-like isoform X2 n=1 Tax=Mizuhopecten yessoensis TaxID=6573 RepID=UPI000B45A43C|nr:C-type mannose receptor 2-like isoform X2 [Mizuhopecten yessoensis]XP_021372925.1 C-type mannose receptor 2-like isoform X3 [Mizuhopecten yessoensis]
MALVYRSESDTDLRQGGCRLLYIFILIVSLSVVVGVPDDPFQCREHSKGSTLSRSYNGVCITFVSARKSWDDANRDCRNQGGLLVKITDQHMQDFVFGVLTSEHWSDTGIWIGATDHDSEGRWMWSDDTNITYSNWHPGEGPGHGFLFSTAGLEDCAMIRVDDNGRWHDYSCGTSLFHHSYMCQYEPCSTLHPNASHVQFSRNSCLSFVKDGKSWIDANVECIGQGGELLQIHNQPEQDFIYERLRSLHWSDSGAWIGATDRRSEGHWKWSDDSPVEYSHWKPGEGPSHKATNENCAMINVDDGMWYDYDCGAVIYNQAYICQYSQ